MPPAFNCLIRSDWFDPGIVAGETDPTFGLEPSFGSSFPQVAAMQRTLGHRVPGAIGKQFLRKTFQEIPDASGMLRGGYRVNFFLTARLGITCFGREIGPKPTAIEQPCPHPTLSTLRSSGRGHSRLHYRRKSFGVVFVLLRCRRRHADELFLRCMAVSDAGAHLRLQTSTAVASC